MEAEIAKNRLEELRQHEFSRRKEALRSRQIAERLGVEEAHMLEFQQFNAAWDKKFQEYETKAAELEEKMKVRPAPLRPPRPPRHEIWGSERVPSWIRCFTFFSSLCFERGRATMKQKATTKARNRHPPLQL